MLRRENLITPKKGTVCLIMSELVKPFMLLMQPSGNTGPEQHAEESRATSVQLLQTLCLGLHERTLQRTQEQGSGLSLSAPQFACFKVIATI